MDNSEGGNTRLDAAAPELPNLEMIRRIGSGSSGQVWLARNRTTRNLVAVKAIPRISEDGVDRTGREILALVEFQREFSSQHQNLLQIRYVGRTEKWLYYTMDPADDLGGGVASADAKYRPATLQNLLSAGPLAPEHCLACAADLLSGLARIHIKRFAHRDVKPSNCLFVGGKLKLADFGLLTQADGATSRVGTLDYMPPDMQMDARADTYAAGLVIYEMMTGLPAACYPRLGSRAAAVRKDDNLRALNKLVLSACQKERQKRFGDAEEMLGALDRLKATERLRKRRSPAYAAALVICAALGLVVWGFSRYGTRRPNLVADTPQPRLFDGAHQGALVHVNFVTHPFEAEVFLDGEKALDADGKPFTTPCTIHNLPAGVHRVVFELPGRPPLDAGQVDFSREREIDCTWPDAPFAP